MFEIESPAIKSNNGFNAHIARYPVKENKLKYYIYLAKSELIADENDKNSLEEFKKYCEQIITQFGQEKLVKLSKKEKKHIIISSPLGDDEIIKMINKHWEYINDDNCYFV